MTSFVEFGPFCGYEDVVLVLVEYHSYHVGQLEGTPVTGRGPNRP